MNCEQLVEHDRLLTAKDNKIAALPSQLKIAWSACVIHPIRWEGPGAWHSFSCQYRPDSCTPLVPHLVPSSRIYSHHPNLLSLGEVKKFFTHFAKWQKQKVLSLLGDLQLPEEERAALLRLLMDNHLEKGMVRWIWSRSAMTLETVIPRDCLRSACLSVFAKKWPSTCAGARCEARSRVVNTCTVVQKVVYPRYTCV